MKTHFPTKENPGLFFICVATTRICQVCYGNDTIEDWGFSNTLQLYVSPFTTHGSPPPVIFPCQFLVLSPNFWLLLLIADWHSLISPHQPQRWGFKNMHEINLISTILTSFLCAAAAIYLLDTIFDEVKIFFSDTLYKHNFALLCETTLM